MEPLSIGVLARLTPAHWTRTFFDDRLEAIDYDAPTDLVAISIESYSARRGYQIAAEFRKRGVMVVMGGYHATFCAEEVLEQADAVCVGGAEGVWEQILADFEMGKLGDRYQGDGIDFAEVLPDRSIFQGKPYLPLALVEASRGCPHHCSFCSITSFHRSCFQRREIRDVVADIKAAGKRTVFFVDDNLSAERWGLLEMLDAIAPLKLRWISQVGMDVAADDELLARMRATGCQGVLIGFESTNDATLAAVGKQVNRRHDIHGVMQGLRRHGIGVYGTFMFGLDADTSDSHHAAVQVAIDEKFMLAAGRMSPEKWWLDEDFRFGQAPFEPEGLSAEQLQVECDRVRRQFFSVASILRRALDPAANCRGLRRAGLYFSINAMMRRELSSKFGLPLGLRSEQMWEDGRERAPDLCCSG
jgi:radical SAM superfamily enzyme YgiQ (UPF0313 family)